MVASFNEKSRIYQLIDDLFSMISGKKDLHFNLIQGTFPNNETGK
jgi:hypothetical protein